MVKQRYVLASMMFLVLGVNFVLLMNFSLLLTQMVYIPNQNRNNSPSDLTGEFVCPVRHSTQRNGTSNSTVDYSNRFQWSQELQGIIVSSFFWGCILSQLMSGILIQKWGAKVVFLISTLLSAIVLTLTPLAIEYGGAIGLIAARVLFGFLQGPLLPSMSSFQINWFPVEERGRINSVYVVAINHWGKFIFQVGSSLSSYFIGQVMHHFGQWSIVFYTIAVLTAIAAILFALLCHDTPQSHPFISVEEKEYLKSRTAKYLASDKRNLPPTPWKAILSSKPVIALLVSIGFYCFGMSVLNAGYSKYMNDVLHTEIERNSIFNSIPRVVNIFLSTFVGSICDWMMKRNFNLTTVRKSFVALSSLISGIFAAAASYAGCDETLVAILLSISISGHGFDSAGLELNSYDLGPNYVGPVASLVYTVATGAALLAPTVVGLLAPNSYFLEWRYVFWLIFTLYISATVIFTKWGSSEVQPWNSPQKLAPNA